MHDGLPILRDAAQCNVRLARNPVDSLGPFEHLVHVRIFHSRMGKFGMWEDLGVSHNARTDAGAAYQADLEGNAAGVPAKYIGITTDTAAPVKTDATLPSEETTNGLQRVLATYTLTVPTPASLNGQVTYTLHNLFTYGGSTTKVIAKGGCFTAVTAGTLVYETLFPSPGTVNGVGDKIDLTWTFNC